MKKYFLAIFIFFNVNIISEVKIEDCASIESDAKRLACYDYLVTGMSKSIDEIDVTTSVCHPAVRCATFFFFSPFAFFGDLATFFTAFFASTKRRPVNDCLTHMNPGSQRPSA